MTLSAASAPRASYSPIPTGRPAQPWARASIGLVVLLLALLQALGPFLHAHARAAHGTGGLHLHLVGAGQAAVGMTGGDHRVPHALPMAAPDEGSAVFLTTEYRRDVELVPVLVAASVLRAAVLRPAAAGEGHEILRWPADGAQAPPGAPPHRLPPATAPPAA